MIRPYSTRERPLAWPVILGALALGALALFTVALGSGLGASLAIEGHVAAYRPIAGTAPLCPAAAREDRP